MFLLQEETIYCPYCGEKITILIDQEAGEQYVEDCQVCCRPIVLTLSVNTVGAAQVMASCEDDAV